MLPTFEEKAKCELARPADGIFTIPCGALLGANAPFGRPGGGDRSLIEPLSYWGIDYPY